MPAKVLLVRTMAFAAVVPALALLDMKEQIAKLLPATKF
jgi:hypothetical protein